MGRDRRCGGHRAWRGGRRVSRLGRGHEIPWLGWTRGDQLASSALTTTPRTSAKRSQSAVWRALASDRNEPSASSGRAGGAGQPPALGGRRAMIKFDHLNIPVTDLARSRDWYVRTLGLKVEFEVPAGRPWPSKIPTTSRSSSGRFDLPSCRTSVPCDFRLATSTPRSRTGPQGESSLPTARASPIGATGPSSPIPTDT